MVYALAAQIRYPEFESQSDPLFFELFQFVTSKSKRVLERVTQIKAGRGHRIKFKNILFILLSLNLPNFDMKLIILLV